MKDIEMKPVPSSNIEAVGHDGEKTLRIAFKNGATYDYIGVEKDLFAELLASDSVGKFFHARIRGQFEGVRLEEEAA